MPKQRAASRKLFSLLLIPNPPPHQMKSYYVFGKKVFMEMYSNIQTFGFKVLQKCSSLASRNGAAQMFFLTPNRNMFAGRFVKS